VGIFQPQLIGFVHSEIGLKSDRELDIIHDRYPSVPIIDLPSEDTIATCDMIIADDGDHITEPMYMVIDRAMKCGIPVLAMTLDFDGSYTFDPVTDLAVLDMTDPDPEIYAIMITN
jgi:hypothetical protein